MIASEVESETIHVIHSDLKLQDSIDKAPEQGTDIELTLVIEYRLKVNLEDNNEPTEVVNKEHINAEKPVLDPSGDNEKICDNTGRMQLSIDHPLGKTFIGNIVGSDIETQMESAPITHASTDVEYSPNRSKTLTSKLCEKEATETSSSNIHMELKKLQNLFKLMLTLAQTIKQNRTMICSF